jgi:type IV pilus assembly protein PilB
MQLLLKVIQQYQLLSKQKLQNAIKASTFNNQTLLGYLVDQKVLSGELIGKSCSRFYHLPYENLYDYSIEKIRLLQKSHRNLHIIILKETSQCLKIAIACPEQLQALDDYQWHAAKNISIVFVNYALFTKYQRLLHKTMHNVHRTENNLRQAIQHILQDAIHKKASDIHFEPHKFQYRIRLRVDGLLYELQQLNIIQASSITNCLKVTANLDIAENRLPQDGRFIFHDEHNIAHPCRLSTCSTLFGEKCVVRILQTHKSLLQNANNTFFTEQCRTGA